MSNTENYIECGKIINTHGCHGGVKLDSWCNSPEELASLKKLFILKNGAFEKIKVKKTSVFKQFVIAELDGVNDMDAAMALKNTVVYASRDDFELEEGEFFIADLIGVKVIDASDGTVYGQVSDIINRGASDIYVVDTTNGERMIPAVDEFIDRIDIKEGIFVNTIPGLLD
ncbi:MAG: 16S rRNA processing protein RimM [Ruminococcaceae bacterium]|nr:16S rRNA processing protein RimM [Oscillospiraceae bacterium]